MTSWQRYEVSDNDGIAVEDIEAVIDTVDAANWEEDLDLDPPLDEEADPEDDE